MLKVISLENALEMLLERFGAKPDQPVETVCLDEALNRFTAVDIDAVEGVPPFDRSTVDGFAVRATDTFGCSESMPALLDLGADIPMGAIPEGTCEAGACRRISTGGMLPDGADAVVMLEYVEEYGDGTVGVTKPASPGSNVVYRYDDFAPEDVIVPKGTRLHSHHIGSLASLGLTEIEVAPKLNVGIISSGDEIVPCNAEPQGAQMRDVNAPLLASLVSACSGRPVAYGIVTDDEDALGSAVAGALDECDIVIVSGGTSVSAHDGTPKALSEHGELLFHGLAVKPGKPTLCADAAGKPLFGLPGHPAAAYYVFCELVAPVIAAMSGCREPRKQWRTAVAALAEAVPSNHGRAEFVPVKLEPASDEGIPFAMPVRSKSGLISQLLGCDGYFIVARDSEGLPKGSMVVMKYLPE